MKISKTTVRNYEIYDCAKWQSTIGETLMFRKILSEHLKYGGSMDEVMEAFTEAMKTAGFGEEAEEPPKSGGKKTKAATE